MCKRKVEFILPTILIFSAILQISCATTKNLGQETECENSTLISTFNSCQYGQYFLQEIDLSSNNLELVATHKKGPGFLASRKKAFVAINSTPFTKTGKLVGIHREKGEDFSRPAGKYDALCFDSTLTAFVVCNQELIPDSAIYAFGGFWCILKDGIEQPFKLSRKDSRCAAGISSGGKKLFILTSVAGKKSKGLSYQECSRIFKELGCTDAIQFDGGSSTTLYVMGKRVAGPFIVPHVPAGFGFCLTP